MINKLNKLRSDKGFSLIEMLIAITIFAVGLLAMAQLQTHAIVYNAQAQRHTVATIHAQNIIDELRAMDFDLLIDENNKTVPIDGYTITTKVTPDEPDPSDTAIQTIDIEVMWTYKGAKNYTLTTAIAKYTK